MTSIQRKGPFDELDWQDPDLSILGDDLPEAPTLPLSCLTSEWAQWVRDAAVGKGCPEDYVFGGLLVSAAALLSGSRSARPWGDWVEPAILWAALVGNPSSGKSPALDTVLAPLRKIEARLASEFQNGELGHSEAVERAQIAKDHWREALKKATREGAEEPEMPSSAHEPEPPHRSRLVTSDTTIEKVALILSANKGRGVLGHRDELSGWLMNFERRGGSDRAFWVECYGGRPHIQDRVKHPKPVEVDCLAVSVIGGIQPDRLRSFTVRSDDDGMASRFLFLYPAGSTPFERPKRIADSTVPERAFARLANLEAEQDENGRRKAREIPFSDRAANVLEKWRREAMPAHERMSRGLLLSAVGKFPGLVVRLALVFEYLAWATENDRQEPDAIGENAVLAAINFVEDYVIGMARRALAAGSQSDEARNAALVAQWFLENPEFQGKLVNLRELRRMPGFPVNDPKALDLAMPLLVDASFCRRVPAPEHQPGTKRKDFLVSPLLRSAKSAKLATVG
jgi:hypothetical protein